MNGGGCEIAKIQFHEPFSLVSVPIVIYFPSKPRHCRRFKKRRRFYLINPFHKVSLVFAKERISPRETSLRLETYAPLFEFKSSGRTSCGSSSLDSIFHCRFLSGLLRMTYLSIYENISAFEVPVHRF